VAPHEAQEIKEVEETGCQFQFQCSSKSYVCLEPTSVVQMAKVHPWLANQSLIDNATTWSAKFFNTRHHSHSISFEQTKNVHC
jgi:hypothetical protein